MEQTAGIIGIDLGTTNSVAAVVDQSGRPVVLRVDGEGIIPSMVAVDEQGKLLVGRAARNYLPVDPDNTVRSVKRSMGSNRRFNLRGHSYTPQQISALILRKMKALAEEATGQPVQKAVITVPAYFSDEQRTATKEAGELAGLEVVRIINEPTAAALAFGIGRDIGQRVLVYDLGGGTFDVSLVQIDGSMVEVLATAGNNHLGGDDFDQRILDYVTDRFRRDHGVDLRQDRLALARLSAVAEQAKIYLSDHPYARMRQEFVVTQQGAPLHLDEELSRERFEELIADLLQDTLACVDQVMSDAKCRPRDLDKVLLVGGSTRIPAVCRLLADHLGLEPSAEIHPDECVALGAAVQAAIIAGVGVEAILVDVTAHSLGLAAVKYLGGRLLDDCYSVVIPRNTVIPAEKAELYTTPVDNQTKVEIKVYQGEEPIASHNNLLGAFMLEGLPPRPAGQVQIEVTFNLTIDGILQVGARERTSGKSADITVRDMRTKMDEYSKAEQEAAVSALWDNEGIIAPKDTAATQAMLTKARALAGSLDGEERAAILALVAEIDALLQSGDYEDDELAELEDELLDLLDK